MTPFFLWNLKLKAPCFPRLFSFIFVQKVLWNGKEVPTARLRIAMTGESEGGCASEVGIFLWSGAQMTQFGAYSLSNFLEKKTVLYNFLKIFKLGSVVQMTLYCSYFESYFLTKRFVLIQKIGSWKLLKSALKVTRVGSYLWVTFFNKNVLPRKWEIFYEVELKWHNLVHTLCHMFWKKQRFVQLFIPYAIGTEREAQFS